MDIPKGALAAVRIRPGRHCEDLRIPTTGGIDEVVLCRPLVIPLWRERRRCLWEEMRPGGRPGLRSEYRTRRSGPTAQPVADGDQRNLRLVRVIKPSDPHRGMVRCPLIREMVGRKRRRGELGFGSCAWIRDRIEVNECQRCRHGSAHPQECGNHYTWRGPACGEQSPDE